MTTLGMHQRLKAQIAEAEARFNARLDAIQEGLNRLLGMAGLPLVDPPAEAPAPPAEPAEAEAPDDHQGDPS
jgi:hypothetical protein